LRVKRAIICLILLTAGLASAGPARAEKCRAKVDRLCEEERSQRIPLRIYRDFFVVAEGRLGDASASQNFILDTGTRPSIINSSQVKHLGLVTTPLTLRAFGKTIEARAAVIPMIELGPITAVSLPVQVRDLSWFESDLGIPIAGIIGMDVLSMFSFHLDYEKSEVEFGDTPHEGIPAHIDARSGLALAEVRIEGKEARLLVDTGSNRVVLFGGNFADAGWLTLRNTLHTGASLIDPKMHVQEFSAADIILGGQHFSDDLVYFIPKSSDPVFDGLLGVRALGIRGLSFDQASGTIYLEK
jgi:hypothetical protein